MMMTNNYIRTKSDEKALELGYYFDAELANKWIDWIETTFEVHLYQWQKYILFLYYGWRRPDGGYRFNQIYIWIPKKNGKTTLISWLVGGKLFELEHAKIYSCSHCAKQSKILMDELVTTFKKSKKIKKLMRPRTGTIAAFSNNFRRDITHKKRNNQYYALADNVDGSDGLISNFTVLDEEHRMKNRLIEVVKGSTTNNPDACTVIISTAGDGDKTHLSWMDYQYTKQVLNGDVIDIQLLPIIYECPNAEELQGEEIYDLDLLVACNPVLQECPDKREQAAKEMAKAKEQRIDAWWRRFRLGQWLSTDGDELIKPHLYNLCEEIIDDAILDACPVYVGIDKGGQWDFTGITFLYLLDDGRIYEKHYTFIGADRIQEIQTRDDKDYSQYIGKELITIPDDAISDEWLYEWLKNELDGKNVGRIGADPYLCQYLLERLNSDFNDGKTVKQVQQSNNRLLTPTIEFWLDGIRQKKIIHARNELFSWQLTNARLYTTSKDTKKIVKAGSSRSGSGGKGHIDNIDATINALAVLREATIEKAAWGDSIGNVYG